ncbi:hypothetical protein [Streptosporangium sandarakinum]|uniref:hypothetical protein n=1 Tax=Streptosporangium sandarakinum TaxID=1260955 RepID=UPI0033ABFDC3
MASAPHNAEVAWSARIASRLSPETTQRIDALVGIDDASCAAAEGAGDRQEPAGEVPAEDDDTDSDLLALIRSAPGNVSLESMMTEIRKLAAVRSIELPPELFADVAPKVLAAWRVRAAVEAPSHMRTHPRGLTVLLLAALVQEREREITDALVELLIATVHRIKARADSKVTKELQDVLADPEWAQLLKPADQRGLTPLFWQHVQPYGEVRLDVAKRLSLGGAVPAPEAGSPD